MSNRVNGKLLPWSNPWVWSVPLVVSIVMATVFFSHSNSSLFLTINHASSLLAPWVWENVTTFGDSLVIFSLMLFLVHRQPRLIWALMLAAIAGTVLVHGLKEWVLVMRPPAVLPHESFTIIGTAHKAVSFPSGHTTAIFTLMALFCLQCGIGNGMKLLALLLAISVGISRIAVGVHWPLDVLGGALIGYTTAAFGLWLAPQVAWGETPQAQRIFAVLLVLTALTLLFVHDSGYAQARWLEMMVAAVALGSALPRLRKVFRRSDEELRMASEVAEELEAQEPKSIVGVVVRIVVTAVIFFLIFRSIDLQAVLETMKNIVPRLLLLGLLFQIFSTFLASYRWHRVMRPLGFPMSFGFYLKSYFKGSFFNQGLPTSIGGDAIRVLDVARNGYRKRDAFYGVFVDRVLGLVGLLLLNLLANTLNPNLLPDGVFLTINVLVGGGLLGFVLLLGFRCLEWPKRWTPTRLFHTISETFARVLYDKNESAVQLLLSVLVHLLSMIAIFLIGRSVELEFDLLTFLIIVPPVILLTLIPVSLAGWGVREGAMIGLFTLIGADKSVVLSMSILYGVVLIISSLPGLYVYLNSRYRI